MTTFGEILSSGEVRFERMLPGTVEQVWRYLTEATLLSEWLGDSDCDLTPNASCHFRFDRLVRDSSNDDVTMSVNVFQPPFTLEFSWASPTDRSLGARSHVSISLHSSGGRSVQLTLRHLYFGDQHIDSFGAGWHTHLDFLYSRLIGATIPRCAFDAIFERVLPTYELYEQEAMTAVASYG